MRSLLVVHGEGNLCRKAYLLHHLCQCWEEMGCRVLETHGPRGWPEADGVLLHVDLSVVPPVYAKRARRYPLQWNADARDIRKRSVLKDCLGPGDRWDGPVIVKTDLNYAGLPEYHHARRRTWMPRWYRRLVPAAPAPSKASYRIHASLEDVPADLRTDPAWVVQPFHAERELGEYLLREYYFLGDAECLRVEASPDPVITSGRLLRTENEGVPPELRTLRTRLGLDYGKIDYVLHEGHPIVFDVNKTVGAVHPERSADLARILARGLFPECRSQTSG